ncbi:MAG: dihydrodipicolinate synthase family protein [Anaerolineae bacterium]
MTHLKLEGIMPPIPTAFDADGNILHDKMRANLARWFAAGLHGVVVLGSNGEYVMLNEAEKCAVWETARDAIPRDRLFIAGAGAESTAATIGLTRRAGELGADAVLIVTPHYYRSQMNGPTLIRHYRAVADASPLPVLLYNVTANTGVDMEAATIIELAQHPNIAGIKDSTGNLAKMGEVIQATPASFAFFVGTGSYILPALAIGAKGSVPALGNVAPRECVQIFDAFHRGDYDTARQLQLRLIRLNAAATSRWSVAGLKAALDELGYYGGPPRPPLLPLGENDRVTLRAIIREAGI